MNEIRPAIVEILGTLASISSVDAGSHEMVPNDSQAITVLDGFVDKISTGFMELWVSDIMVDAFGFKPILFSGNIIHAIAEQHIAGVTTYTDAVTGEVKAHTKNGFSVNNIYNGTDSDIDFIGLSDRAYNRMMTKRDDLELAFKETSKDSRKDRFSLSKNSTSPLDVRIENLQKELAREGNSVARIQSIQKAIDSLLDQKNATSVPEESIAEPKSKRANQVV